MDRRSFIKATAAGAGAVAMGSPAAKALVNLATPVSTRLVEAATATPVKTIVVLMMENRSVDHYLGWYGTENPDFDGTTNATFVDPTGTAVATENWGLGGRKNYHGRGYRDPSHNISGGRAQMAGGAMNGWLSPSSGTDEFAVSYYRSEDVPVWADLVRGFTTYDRYFCSFLGNTQPNRWYLVSAQTGGEVRNTLPPERAQQYPEWTLGYDWPTIYTLLDAAGVSWASYFSNLPNTAFWGPRHIHNTRHISEYYAAAAAGTLPQVVMVEPWYGAPEGIANDDHPHADLRLGQEFLSDACAAFVESPQFADGAMFVTYDEWGGFWDHVPPPLLPDSQDDPTWERYRPPALNAGDNFAGGFGQLGMRVPTATLSPWHTGGRVDHGQYDHVSILKFIGENFGLPVDTLNPKRMAATTSMAASFDFGRAKDLDVAVIPYDAPTEVRTEPIQESFEAEMSPLHVMRDSGFLDRLGVRTDYRIDDSFRRSRPRIVYPARVS